MINFFFIFYTGKMLTSFAALAAITLMVSVVIGMGLGGGGGGEPIGNKLLLERLSDSSIIKYHRQSSWGNKSDRSSGASDVTEGADAGGSQNSTLDGKATYSATAAAASSGIKGQQQQQQQQEATTWRKTATAAGSSKKGSRRHKAIVINYPFQQQQIPFLESNYPGGGGGQHQQDYRKKYDDSNIYYIRLPPTPYMFVPGLGYVSQPPKYSPPPPFVPLIQQQHPKPHHHHQYQQRSLFVKYLIRACAEHSKHRQLKQNLTLPQTIFFVMQLESSLGGSVHQNSN